MSRLADIEELIENGVFSYPGGGLDVRAAEDAIRRAVAADAAEAMTASSNLYGGDR